jgi:outer membrane protein assembly factor BamD (BamD/ComL family)
MKLHALIGAGILFGSSFCVYGQVRGGTNPPTTGTPPPTTTSPTTNTRSPFPTSPTGSDSITRPVYISGKVIMDDGTAPAQSVVIQRVCNGSPHAAGHTDSKGSFSIDLTDRLAASEDADASERGGFRLPGSASNSNGGFSSGSSSSSTGLSRYSNCDVQAYLPGFRSDLVSLANRHSLDDPDIGTIVLHRLGNVEGLTISVTTAMAPKDAKKAYEKGMSAVKKEKWEDAEREFQKAVDSYPKFAEAWYQFGLVQEKLGEPDAARKSYGEAIKADTKFVSPYLPLTMMALEAKNWPLVASHTGLLLKLNPVDFPYAWYLNSLANYTMKNLDAAEKSIRQGMSNDPAHRYPRMEELLAYILVEKHDPAGGAEHLRAYLKLSPDGKDSDVVRRNLAQLERDLPPEAKKETPAQQQQ